MDKKSGRDGKRPAAKRPSRGRGVPPKRAPLPSGLKRSAPRKKPAPPPVAVVDELIQEVLKNAPEKAALDLARKREEKNAEAEERLSHALKKGVAALLDKKAEKLVVLNLRELTTVADYFVIATATNERQAQALADAVKLTLKAEGWHPLSVEGYQPATWILVDYGDVVFHVFHEKARGFYGLERLWGDAADATATFAG